MEALVFHQKNLKLTHTTCCDIPKIEKDNDVLIKVEYSGVTETDIHVIQGSVPCNESKPFIMGHQFVGVVEKTGKNVHFKHGQRVVVDPNGGCNVCKYCHAGKYHLCEEGGKHSTVGIFVNGGWAEYCKVPDTHVLALPDTVTPEQAALTEPLSCLVHGWDRVGPIYIGENILVVGAGIIGLLWAQVLHHHGHRNVTIGDLNQDRLTLARKMGTDYPCMTPMDIQESGKLFDVIVDCTGVAKAMESSMPLLKPSGRYVIFGCCDPKDFIKINPFEIYKKELTLIAVLVNPFTFPKSIGLLEAMGDKLDYGKLGIEVFAISKYKEALKKLEIGTISRAMFKL